MRIWYRRYKQYLSLKKWGPGGRLGSSYRESNRGFKIEILSGSGIPPFAAIELTVSACEFRGPQRMGHPAKGARLAKTIKAAGEVKAAGEGACAPRLGKEIAQFFSPLAPKRLEFSII